jgi:hypothetical protein
VFARQGATLAEAAKPCSAAEGGEQSKRFFFEKKNQKTFARGAQPVACGR